MASTASGHSLIDAVRSIAPIIRENADRSEKERRLSPETVLAMKRAGLYRIKIDLQLAAAHALQSASDVAQLVHQAAGTGAIRREHAFERRFRDIHVLTQHAFASANRFESVGKMLFGQRTDWPFLTL